MHPTNVWDPVRLRELLLAALPDEPFQHGAVPQPPHVYLPASHGKALEPNAAVVVGIRGAGKSFWWSALQEREIRALVSRLAPHAGVSENMRIAVGFGERQPGKDTYPGRDTLEQLLADGIEPRQIWRAVVAYYVMDTDNPLHNFDTWKERVAWLLANPERVEELLARGDAELHAEGSWFMILFDALERTTNDWKNMHRLIRGLLETALDMRSYRRLRLKCFLRTDQLDERRVADFADASKVLASKVELVWTPQDLFGLLWQYLGNARHEDSEPFVQWSQAQFRLRWDVVEVNSTRVRRVDPTMVYDETTQRELFHSIAGPWMGRDRRRGFPYTWIPNHLADAGGNVSPRSFLASLRAATEDTKERYPQHETALHYESIKRGVQRASHIRVTELREDYPWLDVLMEPVRGVVVPCEFGEVEARWLDAHVLQIMKDNQHSGDRLPPAPRDGDLSHETLRLALEEIGVFRRARDGRVDVPDVFRVGYGLGRKGGVKPLRGHSGA